MFYFVCFLAPKKSGMDNVAVAYTPGGTPDLGGGRSYPNLPPGGHLFNISPRGHVKNIIKSEFVER